MLPVDTEPQQLHGGQLLAGVCDAMVTIFRDFSGKGPHHCKSHWAGPDILVVLLRGGYTVAEQTLADAGHGTEVMASRHTFQRVLEDRMTEAVERLTGRTVDLPAQVRGPRSRGRRVEGAPLRRARAGKPRWPARR